jgi:hypothetical protein
VPASPEYRDLAWRQDEDGSWIVLRITAARFQAIGVEPEAATMTEEAAQKGQGRQAASVVQQEPMAASGPGRGRTSLRDAASALLGAWDTGQGRSRADSRRTTPILAAACQEPEGSEKVTEA